MMTRTDPNQEAGGVPANPSPLAGLLAAVEFAARKHRTQTRKDREKSPYINHPVAVAHLLASEGGVDDLVTLQAAILHDTIEDTGTTYDELVERFGREVADVVAEVTDTKSIDRLERKRLQVVNAAHKSVRAAMVKIADKTCNLRDITATPPHDWTEDRKQEYFDWARKVVDALPDTGARLRECFDRAFQARPSGQSPAPPQ
jgi:GTP diphosphokinase / guanosine-3',5'-bis(diphosphate) 3'-diphosphatase